MSKPSVFIAIPSADIVQADFAISLAVLTARASAAYDIGLVNMRTPSVESTRNRLAHSAIESGMDYVLWVDSDMVFPPDALVRLMSHCVDFVGVNYKRREYPYGTVSAEGEGLYRVDAMGFGFVLMKTELLTAVGAPQFELSYGADRGPDSEVSSDNYFCKKAAALGFQAWVDGDLSKQIGHVAARTLVLD